MNGGSLFLQQLINGLSLGSIYALIALVVAAVVSAAQPPLQTPS